MPLPAPPPEVTGHQRRVLIMAAALAAQALAELPYAFGAVLLGDGFLRRQYALMIVLGLLGIGLFTWAAARLHRRIGGGLSVQVGAAEPARRNMRS